MPVKFWEGFSGKLSERWSATVLAPAFVFWAGGLLAWAWRFGWDDIRQQFDQLSEAEKIVALVVGLLIIAISSTVVQSLTLPMLRALEGYWPLWLWWLRRPFVAWQGFWINRHERHWQQLANKAIESLSDQERTEYDCLDPSEPRWQELAEKAFTELLPKERETYVALDRRLRQYPPNRNEWMPTRVGNILRAAERRPQIRYGLDAIICWSRLWLLLPNEAKSDLVTARQALDSAVQMMIWGALLFLWTFLAWWTALAGLLVVIFAYRLALAAAVVYGDLLEAAFDVYRFKLYMALRLTPPATTDERVQGQLLTAYLFRGPPEAPIRLHVFDDKT